MKTPVSATVPMGAARAQFFVAAARVGLSLLRWTLYALLSLFRPLLIPVLTGVSVGGVVVWVIFVLFAHDSDFPTVHVLGASLACAVTAVLYYAVLELLVPGSQRSR